LLQRRDRKSRPSSSLRSCSEREEIKNDVRANLPEAMIKLNAGKHLRQKNELFGKGPGDCNGHKTCRAKSK
jgi:hypothetical protein